MAKATPKAHIMMVRGYNNTGYNNETAMVILYDSYEIKDALKADGYKYYPDYKAWWKPAVDFLDSLTHIVMDNKLSPEVAIDVANEAAAKGIALTITPETNEAFGEYVKAYYNI